jgi:hypothetical protein
VNKLFSIDDLCKHPIFIITSRMAMWLLYHVYITMSEFSIVFLELFGILGISLCARVTYNSFFKVKLWCFTSWRNKNKLLMQFFVYFLFGINFNYSQLEPNIYRIELVYNGKFTLYLCLLM